MAAGTAIAIGMGALSAGSALMGGQAAGKEADYNAQVAQQQAQSESLAIGAEAERLADEQREQRATGRVMAAQAGGGLSSGQNIMILAEEAQKMQMDQLEMQRQQDITLAQGASQASLLQQQGKNARTGSYLSAITSGAGSYFGAGGKTYLGKNVGKG
jgi:hypothetical protein